MFGCAKLPGLFVDGELTTVLQDPPSAVRHLLSVWSDVPVLLPLDVDWDRGPLVPIGYRIA